MGAECRELAQACFRPDLTVLGIDDLDIDDEVTTDNPVAPRERGLNVSAERGVPRRDQTPRQTVGRLSGKPLILVK